MTNGESIIKQAIPNPFLTIVCNCIERKSLKNFFILLKYNRCSIPFFAKRCYFKEKRKVVDFMYILALIGVVVSVIIMLTFFSGGAVGINIVYYIDIPSLILLCLITIPVLASARLLKDFNNAFSIALAKKDRTLEEMQRAREAVELARKTLLAAGGFSFLFALVLSLANLGEEEIANLGPNLAVTILTLLYAVVFDILLLPISSKIKIKELEYIHKDE